MLPLLLLGLAACTAPRPVPLRVSVVGDVLLARGVPTALARDSAALRDAARQLWAHSRYVVGNLECPLTTVQQPAAKRFVFRAAPRYAGWLRRLGLTHLSLANNHTLDQGPAGLRATAAAVQAAGLGPLGYAADSLAGCRPNLLGADSSVAVFAWSAFRQGMAGEGCVCGRDEEALRERVAAYKTLFPRRAVLVYLHWGHEYAARPSAGQQQQARQLIDCGADAVVGAHPHVVQSAELYRGRPILYSLGNFLFDQRGPAADALALQADFDVRGGRVVATYLRPLRLTGAIPRPAAGPDQARLAARLLDAAHPVRLRPATGGGWQLLPAVAAEAPAASPTPDFFARQLTLTDSAGRPVRVRLRYLPLGGYYQALTQAGATESVLPLGFPVYRLSQGDVDNDGLPDLLVGPLKRTHFDSTLRRRLFVYRLVGGRCQPRWLGSRVIYRLLDFRAVRDAATGRTYVRTVEQQPDGSYCLGRYYWQGFGLVLERFTHQQLTLDAAYLNFIS